MPSGQDVSPQSLASTSLLVQRVSHSMRDALAAPGVVVLNASGPSSGQSVDHLHFHVVPCWPDDGADFWPVDRSSHPPIADAHQLLARALQRTVEAGSTGGDVAG
jgi:histidine triad (HIT) family protein